jgi:hypothetical protein
MSASQELRLSPDCARLTISVKENGTQTAEVVAAAAEVDYLLRALAGYRRRMLPKIGRTPPAGDIPGEVDPLWVMPKHTHPTDTALLIRHYGFGWVSFFFSEQAARRLGLALLGSLPEQAKMPVQPTRIH